MHPNEWGEYQFKTEDQILDEILTEEIAGQDRRRGKTGSRSVAKRQFIYTAVFAVAVVLWTLLPGGAKPWIIPAALVGAGFLTTMFSKKSNRGCGCLPVVVLLPFSLILATSLDASSNLGVTIFGIAVSVVAYILLMVNSLKKGRISMLSAAAKANPDRDIAQLVAEDSYVIGEEKPLGSSKAILAAILAAAVAGSGLGFSTLFSGSVTSDEDVEAVNNNPQAAYTWHLTVSGYVLEDFDAGTEERNPNIPSTVDGIAVVGIGERAFQGETRVTEVVLPDSIIEIGSYAFKGCENLVSITMGDQVTAIGGEAFMGCSSLTSFTVPTGVTEIRGNTFQDCTALKTVTLHDGLTAIHAYAFNNCRSLESITLPSGITEIRANTFENCASLKSIEIPKGVTRIAAHAFRGCSALAQVSVPATVREIGSSAFRDCAALKEIYIPEDCVVDERAFKDSPTDVVRTDYFTQEQWDAIIQEADEKIVDVLYFVYSKEAGADKVFYPGEEGWVVIANSEAFTENIASTMALQPMYDYIEVLAYLNLMKDQGAEYVKYCVLSPTASEIAGENWFLGVDYSIDEMIAQAEAGLAEQ